VRIAQRSIIEEELKKKRRGKRRVIKCQVGAYKLEVQNILFKTLELIAFSSFLLEKLHRKKVY